MSTPPRSAATQPGALVCTCQDEHYARVLTERDHLGATVTGQRDEIAALKKQLALSEFRRLVLVRDAAIAAGDRAKWARAVADMHAIGLAEHDALAAMEAA